ncbi:MAG TPA: putative sulfate/molybdate transporter [Corynebacterium amycolatum]|nr:putative sulfate/molybdate transporter [Corynebacterium amycolatum]
MAETTEATEPEDQGIGQASPHWKMGPFDVRLPFVHYRMEWPDFAQGLFMCVVDLGAIPLMTEALGMPYEAALAVVMLNGLLYLTHHLLGDPVVPGWITPAIPLLTVYIQTFPEGEQRIWALISFQLMLGIFSLTLGITGWASKVVRLIPSGLRSGIVLGAGIAAIISVFQEGGRFHSFPITITIAAAVAFFLMYSRRFQAMRQKAVGWRFLASLGILPAIFVAVFVAPLAGEAPWPDVEWGFSKPDFMTLWSEYTVFGIGLPPAHMFLTAIPTVLAAYIVVFGDVLQANAVLKEADHVRTDEAVVYSPSRAHLLFGGRNMLMSIIGPDVAMCGPLWAAMHVVIVERYKQGKRAMRTIFGGAGSFRWGTNTGLLLLPITSFVEPILPVGLALTLIIQGFVSVRVGIMESKNQKDLGIAGVTAGVLATQGAAWGFAAGIIMVLVVYGKDMFKDERDGTIRNFDEIDPEEGFADAQAEFTELAELNDLDADGRPIDPNAPKPKDTDLKKPR